MILRMRTVQFTVWRDKTYVWESFIILNILFASFILVKLKPMIFGSKNAFRSKTNYALFLQVFSLKFLYFLIILSQLRDVNSDL